MRLAIIGRTEILYDTAVLLQKLEHEIALIVTAKEAPEYTRTARDFEVLAATWKVPFLSTPRIEEAIGLIRSIPPIQAAVSINYSGVIPDSVTSLFSLGILNAHGGDLPRYRGNACQAWAILNGEERIGLCIHRMVGGELDNGDILAREYFPLSIHTKITAIYEWLGSRIPALYADALEKTGNDPAFVLERQSKDPAHTLRCYPLRPEDGRIDWRQGALRALRLINAFNRPYSGAFCEYEGRRVTIWDAELAPEENFLAMPGQITRIGDGYVDVAAGGQKLRVQEIEVEGETMSPDKLIRSIRKRLS